MPRLRVRSESPVPRGKRRPFEAQFAQALEYDTKGQVGSALNTYLTLVHQIVGHMQVRPRRCLRPAGSAATAASI